MALLLFIDTCADEGFLGLAENDEWMVQKKLSDARRFGELLHTEAGLLIEEAGKSWGELNAVAVVSGPGSYTGLRVGMAAAKGWCFAGDIPLIALNRLELLLYQWRAENPLSGKVALLLPARAGEWFTIAGDEEGNLLFPSRHFTDAAFKELAEKENFAHIVLAGKETQHPTLKGVENVAWISEQISKDRLPSILSQRFQTKAFADLWTAKPEYLKEVYIAT